MYGLVLKNDVPVRVWQLYGKAQRGNARENWKILSWGWFQASCHHAQGIINRSVKQVCMCTATPYWCVVLGGGVDKGQDCDA